MKKVLLTFGVSAIIIIGSCSKDQKSVNRLEGDWKVTSVIEDGVAQPDSSYKNETYTFEKCKVKKGACDGKLTDGGKTVPFTYSISDKGSKITINMNILGTNYTESGDILEQSKTKFRWKYTDNGSTTETTIEKK